MAEPQDPMGAVSTPDLAQLEIDLDRELEQMQAPQQQKAVARLFEVGGVELGQAALDAARFRG